MRRAIKSEFMVVRVERYNGSSTNGSKTVSFFDNEDEAISKMLKEWEFEIKRLGSEMKGRMRQGYKHFEIITKEKAYLWHLCKIESSYADFDIEGKFWNNNVNLK